MSTAIAYRRSGENNFLIWAVALSIVLHGLLLAVHFVEPGAIRFKPASDLEIILVNKKGAKPVKATSYANVDAEGGGEDEKGTPKSFLPAVDHTSDGELTKDPVATVARLEAEQKRLLTQLQASNTSIAPETHADPQPTPDSEPLPDLDSLRQQIARQEAQLDKQIEDYNARPKRGYLNANAKQVSYAMYYRAWADKIERIGTLNYPAEARGKLYGSLMLAVTLNPDGTIYNNEVRVVQSSGNAVLDRAAKNIVRMSAPFGRFTDDMRRDFEIFEIVAKFEFTHGDAFEADIGRR